jgi:hypothetical protein
MKKTLVLFLAFLILTNFHCARFNLRTEDTIDWIASIPATLLQTAQDSYSNKKGTLVLSEESLLFIYKDGSSTIPYAQIHGLEYQRIASGPMSGPATPSFAKEEGILAGAELTIYLVIGFLVATLLVWIIFGDWSKSRSSVQLDIYFTSNEGNEMSTFKMTRENLAKIYPLLAEKIDQ